MKCNLILPDTGEQQLKSKVKTKKAKTRQESMSDEDETSSSEKVLIIKHHKLPIGKEGGGGGRDSEMRMSIGLF